MKKSELRENIAELTEEALEIVENMSYREFEKFLWSCQPPVGCKEVFNLVQFLFAGFKNFDTEIELDGSNSPKDLSWNGCLRLIMDYRKLQGLLGRFPAEVIRPQNLKALEKNFCQIKISLEKNAAIFSDFEKMQEQSILATGILYYVINLVTVFEDSKK
jgi:hypothetical protein